jgi:uncharacterized protein (DUF362 family)
MGDIDMAYSEKSDDKLFNRSIFAATEKGISRRRFLTAVGAATANIIVWSSCSKDKNPTAPEDKGPTGPIEATVAVRKVSSYDRQTLRTNVDDMLDKLGGLGDIIKSGDSVAIKVNLTGGTGSADKYPLPAGEVYWTHPETVIAIGEAIRDAGAGTIYIVESIYDLKSYTGYGFTEAANRLGAQLIDLNQTDPYDSYIQADVGPNAQVYQQFTQNAVLQEVDCFVSLAKAKQHLGAGQTHSMKNLVGTIPARFYNVNGSSHRAGIHAKGNPTLVRTVLDLNRARPINLAVVDAIKTTLGSEGPWNNDLKPASFNRLIISKDPVAADAISVKTIGFDPMADDNTPTWKDTDNYLRIAEETGMGIHDVNKIEVV